MIQNTADAIKSLDAFLVAPDMPQGCEVLVAKIIASLARVKLDLDEIEARVASNYDTRKRHDLDIEDLERRLAKIQPPASVPAPASQAAATPGAPGARAELVEEMARALCAVGHPDEWDEFGERDQDEFRLEAEAALRVVEARRREPTEEECIEANRVYFERAQEFSGTYIECIRAALRRYEEVRSW